MARSDERTEKPTPRRRRESRREGRVTRSQDVGAAMSLVGMSVVMVAFVPGIARSMARGTRTILAGSASGLDSPSIPATVTDMLVAALLPVLAIAVVFTIVAGVGQTGFVLAPKALKPSLKNLSPRKGLEKFKPQTMLWELARTLMKIGLLIGIVYSPITALMDEVTVARSLTGWIDLVGDFTRALLLRGAALAAVIAVGDYIFNKVRMNKQLKMTKQEVKDEYRQSEGDPLLKGHRRTKAREMSRNRMISAVGSADVVVVNPVRLAVALVYRDGDPAPQVVAKGAGRMAKRIRDEAHRNGVPVEQDKPLARTLYRRCQVGQYVPPALFEAVAIVLATVYRRRWRRATRNLTGSSAA